jgi:hypothetical protein
MTRKKALHLLHKYGGTATFKKNLHDHPPHVLVTINGLEGEGTDIVQAVTDIRRVLKKNGRTFRSMAEVDAEFFPNATTNSKKNGKSTSPS